MAGGGGGRDERKVRSVEEMLSPEVELGMAGDGDGGWRSLREEGDLREEEEPEKMAARRSGGGGGLRWRRRLEDGGVAMMMVKNPWPGQGVAAVVAVAVAARRRAATAAAAAAAVGLLPRPSLSSHLRGRSLLSFFK